MSAADDGWNWFAATDEESRGAVADPDLAPCARRWLSSPDGERMMAHLRALTLERCVGPQASDAMLRHLEGQRALVRYLEMLAASAQHAPRRSPPTAKE